jgi:plastocyanin
MTGRVLWLGLLGLATGVAAPPSVAIHGFQYAPAELEVRAGTRVVWTNEDEIAHTVTSGAPDSLDGRFDGALARVGTTYGRVFDAPGVYPYHCARHPFMRGVVRVLPKGD